MHMSQGRRASRAVLLGRWSGQQWMLRHSERRVIDFHTLSSRGEYGADCGDSAALSLGAGGLRHL